MPSSQPEIPFQPHPVEWTREKSARFWNYLATRPFFQSVYFSRMVGDSLLAALGRKGVNHQGRVLDFGSGPGFLVEKLIQRGVHCEAVDFSKEAVESLNRKLNGRPNFAGATFAEALPTPLAPERFELVYFIETIEHLLDADLEATIQEIRRLLKQDGTLVITTPNAEDLDASESFCPDCGCSFHRIQHVRAWTAESLSTFLEARGFQTSSVFATTLRPSTAGTWVFSSARRVLGKPQPNLVWIGTKSA